MGSLEDSCALSQGNRGEYARSLFPTIAGIYIPGSTDIDRTIRLQDTGLSEIRSKKYELAALSRFHAH